MFHSMCLSANEFDGTDPIRPADEALTPKPTEASSSNLEWSELKWDKRKQRLDEHNVSANTVNI